MKIGICAPSTPLGREDAARIDDLARAEFPAAKLLWHEQCFAEAGHFAGEDAVRRAAFVSLANDPEIDAVWFARGGYGAARIAQDAVRSLNDHARRKIYMGYSDGGNLLAALYRAGAGFPVHGPMAGDIRRPGGEVAIRRALGWMVERDPSAAEPGMQAGGKYAAFNLMTLSMIIGTPILPDLSQHILMIEEVSEYLYAFDRAMWHVTSHFSDKNIAGLMLGRVSDIRENDRDFGEDAEAIARRWCAQTGVPYLGRADIGHDIANKIVPFGLATAPAQQ